MGPIQAAGLDPRSRRRTRTCPTIEEMRQLAASRGDQCLSEIYEDFRQKFLRKCHRGHARWELPGWPSSRAAPAIVPYISMSNSL